MGAAAPPLLSGCILKQVKILHENALFLPKIFWGRGIASSPEPTPYSSAPLFQISGSAAGAAVIDFGKVACLCSQLLSILFYHHFSIA